MRMVGSDQGRGSDDPSVSGILRPIMTGMNGETRSGGPTARRVSDTLGRGLVIVILLVLGAAWHGSRRVAAGAAAGTSLTGRTAPWRGRVLRVAIFNIHGGKGSDGRRDLGRTAACLRGFDLVGLNEVHGASLGQPGDQAAQLGDELGRAWLFAPAERRWGRDDFGNGLLSALPVAAWRRVPLPGSRSADRRNVLVARVAAGKRPLSVLVTHLTRSADRPLQLRAVARLFGALPPPALLLGDLNTSPADPALRPLRAVRDVRDPLRGRLGPAESQRLDWILTRGIPATDAGQRAGSASDHPCLWAELQLEN